MIDITQHLRDSIRDYILYRLGYPAITVELSPAQIDNAIDWAIQEFSKFYSPNNLKSGFFIARPGQSEYNLNGIIPDYIEINNVIYNPSVLDTFMVNFFQSFLFDFNYSDRQFVFIQAAFQSITDFYMLFAFNESWLRTIGHTSSWMRLTRDTIKLSPTPERPTPVGIIYVSKLNEEDIKHSEWVRDYALAECMMMLGRIRSKYKSYPNDIQLDGENLIEEAKEIKERLQEEIERYTRPPLFTTG